MQESSVIIEELEVIKAEKNKWNGFADRRPSDYVYALMNQQIYEGKKLKKGNSLLNHKDWIIEKIRVGKSDYFGVIYENQVDNQIVVTHRGSDNIIELKKHLEGCSNEFNQQEEEALDLAKQAIELASKRGAHLSFTGHASAALLAVLNLFYCYTVDLDLPHVSAVVFDGPGARESLEKLSSHLIKPIKLSELDIIEYVLPPNSMNTQNHHLGTLYYIDITPGNSDWINNSFELFVRSMDTVVNLFDGKKYPLQSYYLKFWPTGNIDKTLKLTEISDESLKQDNILPLRHFPEKLQDFLLKFFRWKSDFFSSQKETKLDLETNLTELNVPKNIIQRLLAYSIIKKHTDIFVNVNSAYIFRREISEWLEKYSNIIIHAMLNNFTQEQPDTVMSRLLDAEKNISNINFFLGLGLLSIKIPEPYLLKRIYEKKLALFNIPPKLGLFVGNDRLKLLDKLKKEYLSPSLPLISQIYVWTGPAGIGKTELAKQYLLNTNKQYILQAWFSASNLKDLISGYKNFATSLGYEKIIVDDTEYITYVKQTLTENPGWLIIFDNVKSFEDVKYLIPENGGHVIITTRKCGWVGNFKEEEIPTMSEPDCDQLVKTLIKHDLDTQEKKYLNELIDTLERLPLALAQASAYIRRHQYKNMTISDYLELYKQRELELLLENLPDDSDNLPIAITWNVTFNDIIAEAKKNNQPAYAFEILLACVYLAPHHIPLNMLHDWFCLMHPNLPSATWIFKNSIDMLRKYSIIKHENDNFISISKTLQTILLYQHKSAIDNINTDLPKFPNLLSYLSLYIYREFSDQVNTGLRTYSFESNKNIVLNLLPHAQNLVKHWRELIHDNEAPTFTWWNIFKETFNGKGIKRYVLLDALKLIGLSLVFYQNDFQGAKIYLESSLALTRIQYGNVYTYTQKTLYMLAHLYLAFGDVEQGIKYFEEIYDAQKSIYEAYRQSKIQPHIWTIEAFSNVACAYLISGVYASNPKYIKTAVTKFESCINAYSKYEGVFTALRIRKYIYDVSPMVPILFLMCKALMYLNMGNEFKDACRVTEKFLLHATREYFVPDLYHTLGVVYLWIGDIWSAKRKLSNAIDFKQCARSKDIMSENATLLALGSVYREEGNILKAKELIEKVVKYYQKYSKEYYEKGTAELLAESLIELSLVYIDLEDPKSAENNLNEALEIIYKEFGPNHILLAPIHTNLAIVNKILGIPTKQKDYTKKALKIHHFYTNRDKIFKNSDYKEFIKMALNNSEDGVEKVYFPNNTLNGDYVSLKEQAELEGNWELLTPEISAIEKIYQDLDDDTIKVMKMAEKKKEIDITPKIQLNSLPEEDETKYTEIPCPEVARTLIILGDALLALNEINLAISQLDYAGRVYEYHYGINHPRSVELLIILAELQKKIGNLSKSRDLLEKGLNIWDKNKYNHKSLKMVKLLSKLSAVCTDLKDHNQAKIYLVRALELQKYNQEILNSNLSTISKDISQLEIAQASAQSSSISQKLSTGTNLSEKEEYYDINVPSDGTCLFYSVMFAYLLPVVDNLILFKERFLKLFGNEISGSTEENRHRLLQYDGSAEFIVRHASALEVLVNVYFRKRIVNFMRINKEKFINLPNNENFEERMLRMKNSGLKEWGDQPEIEAMSQFLNIRITVCENKNDQIIPKSGADHGANFSDRIYIVHTTADEKEKQAKNHYHYLIPKQYIRKVEANVQEPIDTTPQFSLHKNLGKQKAEVSNELEIAIAASLETYQQEHGAFTSDAEREATLERFRQEWKVEAKPNKTNT